MVGARLLRRRTPPAACCTGPLGLHCRLGNLPMHPPVLFRNFCTRDWSARWLTGLALLTYVERTDGQRSAQKRLRFTPGCITGAAPGPRASGAGHPCPLRASRARCSSIMMRSAAPRCVGGGFRFVPAPPLSSLDFGGPASGLRAPPAPPGALSGFMRILNAAGAGCAGAGGAGADAAEAVSYTHLTLPTQA